MATGTDQASRAAAPIPLRVWAVAGVVTFGTFMSGLDASLVNVGLDTIGRDLHTDLASTQWINSGYLLALAAALPVSGWLSRRVGSGRVWLLALAAFTIISGLCAAAPTIAVLVAFRVLQGLAGGLLVSTGIAILAQSAGRETMGRVLSITGVPTVLAPALGPTLGALLLTHLSWPVLFVINLPIGILGLLLGIRVLPRGDRSRTAALDLPGLILITAGLPLLTYGITDAAQRQTLTTTPVLVCLIGGLAGLITFTVRSLHHRHPLLDLSLYTNRVFAAATSLTLFSGAALFGGQIVMPLYFQLQRHESVVDTGLLLIPFGLGAALTFPIAGRLTDRYGGGRVAAAGLTAVTLVTIPMTLLGLAANIVLLEALQSLRGVGLALAGAPVIAAAMSAVARHQLDDASAQINIVARVGGALGSAVLVIILTNQLPSAGTDPATAGASTVSAFHATFWWLTAASLIALAAAGWLTTAQRHTTITDASTTDAVTTRGDRPMTRIAIIIGSTRPGRKGEAVARWIHEIANRRDDATFDLVDLADYPLPHLDEPRPAAHGPHYTKPHTQAWANTIAGYDGYIFVTPEYNHAPPGVLKNAIDYLYTEWHNKAAGFVSYGIHGGIHAVEHLRLVMAELQIADVRMQVALSLSTDFHGDTLTPGEHHLRMATTMLDQTIAWSCALAPLRTTTAAATT